MKNSPKEVLTTLILSVFFLWVLTGSLFAQESTVLQLKGNRFFTLSTVVRIRQIETSRDEAHGPGESSVHTPEEARIFRETVERAWPGARITWAFSWLALKDDRPNYLELKEQVVSYHQQYGDEITFTRYDQLAKEPDDPEPGPHSSNWSLMNRLNQKGTRLRDIPVFIEQLNAEEQAII